VSGFNVISYSALSGVPHEVHRGFFQDLFNAVRIICFALMAQTPPPRPSENIDQPDATMMAPVTALVSYMAHVEGAALPPVFAGDGLVIIEDFAPYIFSGKNAAAQWDAGFRHHAIPLKHLEFSFGPAHAFERSGDRVYLVLPTTWHGLYKDREFEEHGAWSFVLTNTSGRWLILAYGWGATDLKDWPARTQ
jgi:hypothetical protein